MKVQFKNNYLSITISYVPNNDNHLLDAKAVHKCMESVLSKLDITGIYKDHYEVKSTYLPNVRCRTYRVAVSVEDAPIIAELSPSSLEYQLEDELLGLMNLDRDVYTA